MDASTTVNEMANKKPRALTPEVVQPEVHMPTVPAAFQQTEYEGWIAEKIKQWQLREFQKTQSERIGVLKQIRETQAQCLAIAENESNWLTFAQRERMKQKRLDIEEIELDMRLEDLRNQGRKLPEPVNHKSEPPDPMQEALDRLRWRLRAGVEARSEYERLKTEFPDQAEHIERQFQKMMWDLREDR